MHLDKLCSSLNLRWHAAILYQYLPGLREAFYKLISSNISIKKNPED